MIPTKKGAFVFVTTITLRVTVMTRTSFEGHVKCLLDDSLAGAFACMQGRRLGHGGPREQPSPPPGSLLGQGPYSYNRQVHGEGVQVTKGQNLPCGGYKGINETLVEDFNQSLDHG